MISTEAVETNVEDRAIEWKLRKSVSIHMVGNDHSAVRDLSTRTYFQVGNQEACLLELLQRGSTYEQAKEVFQNRFAEELKQNDFEDFIELLAIKNLLIDPKHYGKSTPKKEGTESEIFDDEDEEVGKAGSHGNILFYRVPLVNPNRFLNWFVRSFPFFWQPWFVPATTVIMLFSLGIILSSADQLVDGFRAAVRWETIVVGIVAVVTATAIHELGHGATCKRYGGEVVEAGFLLMYFMPCLYINVSDAWIIREKWKRLSITAAGGYCDLLLWALGAIVWRITEQDTIVNYIALIVLTTCGTRSLMNFNPLLRLDGYYLLSDLMDYPNLYRHSRGYWIGTLNWLFWGASKPVAPRRATFAFCYGMMMWTFGLWFLIVIGSKILNYARLEFGLFGTISVGCFMVYGIRRVFRGLIGLEFLKMFTKRRIRFLGIIALVVAASAGSFWLPLEYASLGHFEVRPARDVDLCSPMHSFIATVFVQDGQTVESGDQIVELYAPELTSQIAAKEAELSQSRANLAKLEAGPRQEEIAILENRVRQLSDWSELGKKELVSSETALSFQLRSIEEQSKQVKLQIELAETVLVKTQDLFSKGAVAGSQLVVEKSQLAVLKSQLAGTESEYAHRKEEGVRAATAELARREQDLTSIESQLKLLKLGYRIEEIEMEKARYAKLDEEYSYLKQQRDQLMVRSTAAGVVSAPRLREKVGQFVPRGNPICRIEQLGSPTVELFVPEDEAIAVHPGQSVRLKARALPFDTIVGVVERISPATARSQEASGLANAQSAGNRPSLVVHCRIDSSETRLRSGMTGFGRVACGVRSLGNMIVTGFYRYIRTEFWW